MVDKEIKNIMSYGRGELIKYESCDDLLLALRELNEGTEYGKLQNGDIVSMDMVLTSGKVVTWTGTVIKHDKPKDPVRHHIVMMPSSAFTCDSTETNAGFKEVEKHNMKTFADEMKKALYNSSITSSELVDIIEKYATPRSDLMMPSTKSTPSVDDDTGNNKSNDYEPNNKRWFENYDRKGRPIKKKWRK